MNGNRLITLDSTFKPDVADSEQLVEFRTSWADEWKPAPKLFCQWATWSVGGEQINRALLRWRYGVGKYGDDSDYEAYLRLAEWLAVDPDELMRVYVRIRFGPSLQPLYWYGSIEVINDRLDGFDISDPIDATNARPSGEQFLLCYGLEYQLHLHRVVNSEMLDVSSLVTCQRGLTFNASGRGNRSDTKPQNSYVFAYNRPNVTGAATWSTRDCVEYLLEHAVPLAPDGTNRMPWRIAADSIAFLPDYDAPQFDQHGRRTIELLDNLIARERLLTWWYTVSEDDGVIDLRVRSFTDQDIDLGGGFKIPANPTVYDINFDRDTATRRAVHVQSSLDSFDQVVCQGARRTTTCSLSNQDGTLFGAWTGTEEGLYNLGASASPNYPPASEVRARREANNAARSVDALSHVYSAFTLPTPWDGYVGDGQGGQQRPAFRPDDPPFDPVPQYAAELYFSQSLALLEDRDYDGDAIVNQTFRPHNNPPFNRLRPFVCVLPPEERVQPINQQRWLYSDRVGKTAPLPYLEPGSEREWSCRVRVGPESTELLLQVTGKGEQHVIAKQEFSPLPEDDAEIGFDWREWIATVTIEEDRFCEGVWPLVALDNPDLLRVMWISLGEAYRQDYVVPDTVVGIKADTGYLSRTSGGFVQDDSARLRDVAEQAYAWYGVLRTAVSFETVFRYPATLIGLGDYVDYINSWLGDDNRQPINGIVSQLTLRADLVEGEDATPEPPHLSVSTTYSEIDPQSFVALMR